MRDAHRLPDAIQWHEGMLLAPQHFQQQSIRFDELLDFHLAATAPFHWGVLKLSIEESLLVDGTFRIRELEAIMPDGLIVCDSPQNTSSLEVDLTPFSEEFEKGPVTIHLAAAQKKISIDSTPEGALARYRSIEGPPVADDNTGESEITIPRLVPRLSLLVTDTPPAKYTSFPLAKIVYENETYSLTDYIPPSLNVSVQSVIGSLCSNLARRLREKAIFLAERMRSPSAMMKGPMLFTTRTMIQSLVGELPTMEAVLNTGRAHPYALYLAVCSIIGQVASLGRGLIPPVLAPYNHNDLRLSFGQAIKFINDMIDEGILESHTPIPFDLKAGIFSLTLEDAWMSSHLTLGVKVREGQSEKDTNSWIADCLIGSKPIIESLKNKRILGADRQRIEGDEDLIPVRGVMLYSIEVDPEFIQVDQELQVFNITESKRDFRPMEVVLYVKN